MMILLIKITPNVENYSVFFFFFCTRISNFYRDAMSVDIEGELNCLGQLQSSIWGSRTSSDELQLSPCIVRYDGRWLLL